MPSTVYRGDLSEVTFGHESAIRLEHNYAGSFKFTASFETGANATNAPHQDLVKDTSVIVLSGGAANSPVNGNILEFPNGMLVGSKIIFSIASGSSNWSQDDDYGDSGRMFTIIKQEVCDDADNDNDGKTEITVTPALKTDHSAADQDSESGDVMTILPFTTPSIDVDMAHADAANASAESVMTDQFVGLVSTVSLPETIVDLKRYHVVGLGRDVAVQVPGRFTNTGGSFECNIHNGRWFYYALGQEVVNADSVRQAGHASGTYQLNGATEAGTSYIVFDSTSTSSTNPRIPHDGGSGGDLKIGDYIFIDGAGNSTNRVDVQTYRDTGVGGDADADAWPNVNATNIIDKAIKEEARRIVAISMSGGTAKVWLDDPLHYGYDDNTRVYFGRYQTDSSNGSPHRTATTGGLENPVNHLFFSRTTVPSFAMEVSVRRRDTDSNAGTFDGGTGDSKQLTRVFRGCKVKDYSLTADTDAALRMTVNFDSALCYTDTGRLEGAAATATLTALSKSAGEANTRVLTLSDGTNSVNFSIDNSTSTSTASVIAFSNANSNANQFATNIAAAVNAANTAGTLDISAVASSATVTLTQNNKSSAGNTTPSGTAISDSVITLSAAFSGGKDNGDRYNTHRLFEDTANTEVKRKQSGIEKGTQKPYMFYNGTISMLGTQLGQVVSFTLNGKTGVEQYYTIGGANIANSATDQVPFAGTRNPTLAVEGKTEYDLEMEIIVDDPLFYHNMRRSVENFDDTDEAAQTDSDMIRLSFNKVVSSGTAESIDILIDDYYVVEAPLPIPEDKGPLRATLKILPKAVKVIAVDTVIHA